MKKSATLFLLFMVFCGVDESDGADAPRHATARNGLIQILVEPGFPDEAVDYYRDVVAPATNLPLLNANDEPQATIDDVLKAAGYQPGPNGITAVRLEQFESADLNDPTKLQNAVSADNGDVGDLPSLSAGDILATRWFSPKITDVTLLSMPSEYHQYGWRKLVRLKTLPGDLKDKNIKSVYLLFNIFNTRAQLLVEPPVSPFKNPSGNNQIILVRDKAATDARQFAENPIFWLVFDSIPAASGKLKLALNASFDYRHPSAAPPNSAYFAPRACAQCHGGANALGKLNFLDTDHWFDRVEPNDDFAVVGSSAHGVLYDGGKDVTSDQFRDAFAAIRQINREIEEQNADVDSALPSVSLKSVQMWNANHAAYDQHVGVLEDRNTDGFLDRSIVGDPNVSGVANPNDRWRKNDRIDEALLPKLSRSCYRCHSSIIYSIYDRSAIVSRAAVVKTYMGEVSPPDIVPFMPQDRVLPLDERDAIIDLVQRLVNAKTLARASDSNRGGPDKTIEIRGRGSNSQYVEVGASSPQTVEVLVDQVVRWHNVSNVAHTATSNLVVAGSRVFDTLSIPASGVKDIKFDRDVFTRAGGTPGGSVSISYFCVPHPQMTGKILLKDMQ